MSRLGIPNDIIISNLEHIDDIRNIFYISMDP